MKKGFLTSLFFLLALLLCTEVWADSITGKITAVGPKKDGVYIAVTGTVNPTGEVIANPRWFKVYPTKEGEMLATALVARVMDYQVLVNVPNSLDPNSIVTAIYLLTPAPTQ